MPDYRMYSDLAYLWPLISPPEEYADEARSWRDALRSKLGEGTHKILELGVGGGHNLSHLTSEFEATAVDLSEEMLSHSRRLNPGVTHHVGDMRDVRLGTLFDAVLIHDAISYMLTEEDLRAVFRTARAHLRPSGILVLGPDDFKETFKDPRIYHCTRSDGRTLLTYFEYQYDPDPGDTTTETEMFYFIRRGGTLTIERERHTCGLFALQIWLDLMDDEGFAVEPHPASAGLEPGSSFLLVGVLREGHQG